MYLTFAARKERNIVRETSTLDRIGAAAGRRRAAVPEEVSRSKAVPSSFFLYYSTTRELSSSTSERRRFFKAPRRALVCWEEHLQRLRARCRTPASELHLAFQSEAQTPPAVTLSYKPRRRVSVDVASFLRRFCV